MQEQRARADANPDDVEAQIAAAYACDAAGDEATAVGYYEAAWRLGVPEARRPQFLVGFGSTLRNVGRVDEAIARLREATAAYPAHPVLRLFLALAHHSKGDHAEAAATFLEMALTVAPASPEIARYARAIGEYRDLLRSG